MINKDIYQALQQLIPNEKIKVDEPLKRYTYTKQVVMPTFTLPLLKMKKYKQLLNMPIKMRFLLHI